MFLFLKWNNANCFLQQQAIRVGNELAFQRSQYSMKSFDVFDLGFNRKIFIVYFDKITYTERETEK